MVLGNHPISVQRNREYQEKRCNLLCIDATFQSVNILCGKMTMLLRLFASNNPMKKFVCCSSVALSFIIAPVQAKRPCNGLNPSSRRINEPIMAHSVAQATDRPLFLRASTKKKDSPSLTILAQLMSPAIVIPHTNYPRGTYFKPNTAITPAFDLRVSKCQSQYAVPRSCGTNSMGECYYWICT